MCIRDRLYVGAATEVEMKEKKDRVEDALNATRAAVEEGIIPGGGVAFIRATSALKGLKGENDDETTGINIIARAIEEPIRMICENAGKEGSVIVQKVKEGKGDYGYNAHTDTFENFFSTGVIDPTKVMRIALENAASVAGMLLTTECALADIKEEMPPMPMGGGAPGMEMCIRDRTKTAGGLFIPDTAKEKPQQGIVVAVGNGKKDEPMELTVEMCIRDR